MVLCIKCHNPIKKLPVWLSRVKVGFVCDSCKTRPASQQSHVRKPAPPPESVDLDQDEAFSLPLELADLSTEDVVDEDVATLEEPVLAVVSMEETPVAVEPSAEAELAPEPVEVSKKRKTPKPEPPLPEVAIPDDAPHTLLAKKLLQVLAPEESEGKPKGKKATEEKKPKAEPAPEAKKAKAEAAPEPKAKKVAEKEAKPGPAPEPKAKKAKAEAAPEPKAKKAAEKKAKSVPVAAPKPKKTTAKKA